MMPRVGALPLGVAACTLFLALTLHSTQRHTVELLGDEDLDRTIAELRASEHAALHALHSSEKAPEVHPSTNKLERLGVNVGSSSGAWGIKKTPSAVKQTLHPAWNFAETRPRIETEAGVHTGEEHVRIGDVGVKVGSQNPVMPYGAGRDPVLPPAEEPTARPPGHAGRLDDLGVNTGSEHNSWDDGMQGTQGMEDSYSFGSTPARATVREDTSPLATVGLLANVPSRVFPQQRSAEDAHSFFKSQMMPLMGGRVRHVHADKILLAEANKEKKEAILAEKKFEAKVAQARAAERRAHEIKILAEGVSTAKQAVRDARAKEKVAEGMYEEKLQENNKRLAALGVAQNIKVKSTQTTLSQKIAKAGEGPQSALDKAVAGDRRENKRLSTEKDVDDVLGAINSLPAPANSDHPMQKNAQIMPKEQQKVTATKSKMQGLKQSAQASKRSSVLATKAATEHKSAQASSSWACSVQLFGIKPFC